MQILFLFASSQYFENSCKVDSVAITDWPIFALMCRDVWCQHPLSTTSIKLHVFMCYFTVAKKQKQNGFHVSCLCTLLIVWTLTYAIGIVKTRTYRLVPSIHWCKYLVLYVYIYTVSIIFCVQSAFVAFTITK